MGVLMGGKAPNAKKWAF